MPPFKPIALMAVAVLVAANAYAQGNAGASSALDAYRAMLEDGNPSELFEAKGEALWAQPRGPRKVSLQQGDLGQGAGVVKGAFVELPRYFADTGRVQDLESRLMTCMQTLQGFDAATIAALPIGTGEQANVIALATWRASQSTGMKMNLPQGNPHEQAFYGIGKRLFFLRAGPHDFACSSCHGQDGKRIRMQDMPNLTGNPGDGIGVAAWPAYRVSSGEMWGLEQRIHDCLRQQRFPYAAYGSDAIIALGVYMGVNSRGAVSIAPAIRR